MVKPRENPRPTPTVLVSPAATMRVIEAPAVPPGTMTAPPAPLPGPMPGVARFETNREVPRGPGWGLRG